MFHYFILREGKMIDTFDAEDDDEAQGYKAVNFPNDLLCVALGDKKFREQHLVVQQGLIGNNDDAQLF